jgi:hypothetical protein
MKKDERPGPDLFGPGEIDDEDERRLVERLERTIGGSPGGGRSTLIRKQLLPEHSESGRKTLARFKTHLERNAEVSCDPENLFTLDDCPSLPPLEGIGQRFVPPFAGGRMLFRRVEGGETMFSNAVITETSACIDAMSWVGKERALAGFGIPFFPRLGGLPLHRLRITAHLHGFWEWDNFWTGDAPGSMCGFTNRGVVRLVVPGVAGAVSEWILHDSQCEGSRQGTLPATLALELRASLEPRVHVAWLLIEACVEPPRSGWLLCLEALADGNQPLGVHIDECDDAAQASAGITMAACAIDLAYRERTIQEIERERLAEELRDRVRLP